MRTGSLVRPRAFRLKPRGRLVDGGEWTAPRLHLRDSEFRVPGAISGADEVQARADVWGAVGHRAPASRIRTVAFREDLIRRGIQHDERVIVIHVPSMAEAYAGDQSRRSSCFMVIRHWRRVLRWLGAYCRAIAVAPPRNTNFWILPVAVFGKASTGCQTFGALNGPCVRERTQSVQIGRASCRERV